MLQGKSYDEVLLLKKLSEDSEVAFEQIYHNYSGRLYCKMLKLLKSEAIVQELLQDVFISVWEQRQKLDSSKSFCSFLFCIATNKCYDHLRKMVRDKKLRHQLSTSQSSVHNAEENMVIKENSRVLYRVIDLLPPRRKEVFKLCKMEGKSYEEVSHQLGISFSTISDHIVKANLFIREKLLQTVS